jgi:hypothetical protein
LKIDQKKTKIKNRTKKTKKNTVPKIGPKNQLKRSKTINKKNKKLRYEVLHRLFKGSYESKIAQNTNYSHYKIRKTIHQLEDNNFIQKIPGKPILYQLHNKAKLFLRDFVKDKQLTRKQLNNKTISNNNNNNKDKLRAHNYAFENKMIERPNWLSKIQDKKTFKTKYHGRAFRIDIKKVQMTNWCYYDIEFPLIMFEGLKTVRLEKNNVVYYFDRPLEAQYIPAVRGAKKAFINDRIQDCIDCRNFLEKKMNVRIDQDIPKMRFKPEYAFNLNGRLKAGKHYNAKLKLQNGALLKADDSLQTNEGELESEDFDLLCDIVNAPKEIQEIKTQLNDISDIKNKIKNINANQQEINDIKNKLNSIDKNMNRMADQFSRFVSMFSKAKAETQQPQNAGKDNSQSFYQ